MKYTGTIITLLCIIPLFLLSCGSDDPTFPEPVSPESVSPESTSPEEPLPETVSPDPTPLDPILPDSTPPDAQKKGFMSAIVNGVSYDAMKPVGYPSLQSAVEVYTLIGEPGKFLNLEGDKVINNVYVIIELFIEEANWNVGTYDLIGGRNSNVAGANSASILILDGLGNNYSVKDEEATMTIDTFDFVNKRITGTFSFSYYSEPKNGGPIEVFEVTDGTFDFPLDDKEFD